MNGAGVRRTAGPKAAGEDKGQSMSAPAEITGTDERGSRKADIVVHDLVKQFGDFTAVSHTSFKVYRGEVFGMLGPNGAGKTTTFRMLCGLLPATSGELFVGGVDVRRHRNKAREGIGYVAQKFSLYGNLTVQENLHFYGGIYGLWGRKLSRRIDEVVGEFGLSEKLGQVADSLPLGYKQRLSMAAALLHRPKILFLDEPTLGLDVIARSELWDIIRSLKGNVTIILTTHYMEEAEALSDRIAIMKDGRMLVCDTADKIKANAGTDSFEQAFINTVKGVMR